MSVRYKITLGLLVILLASYVVLGLLTSTYVNKTFVKEVQTRVRLDLIAADDIYNSYFEQIEEILMVSSIRRTSVAPLKEEMGRELGDVFSNIYKNSELDFLTFTDLEGNVIYRVHNPEAKGDNISDVDLIRKVLNEWAPVSGTTILDETILKNEGKELQERTVVNVKSTPKARPEVKTTEKRGMVIASAVPINSLNGDKLGVIFGGLLINNNIEIVDRIKTKVFQDQTHNGKDIGTATVFFDDVRISTNVKQTDNTRAIGSRLSLEVG